MERGAPHGRPSFLRRGRRELRNSPRESRKVTGLGLSFPSLTPYIGPVCTDSRRNRPVRGRRIGFGSRIDS